MCFFFKQKKAYEMRISDWSSDVCSSDLRKFLLNIVDQYRRFPEWASLMLDENLHGGVHYGEREKIRAVTRPLLVQFRRILDRGASQRVFAANIDVEKFFAAAFSLTTTCFLTGRVMSEYLPIDLQSSAGMSDWEEYAINLQIGRANV